MSKRDYLKGVNDVRLRQSKYRLQSQESPTLPKEKKNEREMKYLEADRRMRTIAVWHPVFLFAKR